MFEHFEQNDENDERCMLNTTQTNTQWKNENERATERYRARIRMENIEMAYDINSDRTST